VAASRVSLGVNPASWWSACRPAVAVADRRGLFGCCFSPASSASVWRLLVGFVLGSWADPAAEAPLGGGAGMAVGSYAEAGPGTLPGGVVRARVQPGDHAARGLSERAVPPGVRRVRRHELPPAHVHRSFSQALLDGTADTPDQAAALRRGHLPGVGRFAAWSTPFSPSLARLPGVPSRPGAGGRRQARVGGGRASGRGRPAEPGRVRVTADGYVSLVTDPAC